MSVPLRHLDAEMAQQIPDRDDVSPRFVITQKGEDLLEKWFG